jgi:hypothetical protein
MQRDLSPVERLDPHTAVNTTIMAEPWVYAREFPAIAANARDYLNVGVVETNRAGQRRYWLGVVAWSTIDRSAVPGQAVSLQPQRVRLGWVDGELELTPVSGGRQALGANEPIFAPPQPAFREAWYALSPAELERLAREPPQFVSLDREGDMPARYESWQVGRQSMKAFREATGVGSPVR